MTLPARIFIAAHVSKIYGPVQALTSYLRQGNANFSFVSLPFSYGGMDVALEESFSKGKHVRTLRGHESKGWDPWLWSKDFFFVLRCGWKKTEAGPVDLFIGVDCLNAVAGLILKRLGRVRRVAYYVIDYTPRRFGNPALNGIYHAFDRMAVSGADVVWNLSERMREVRAKQGLPEGRNRLVPVGVELAKVKHPLRSQIRRERLIYMGALQEGKGIDLLIEAFAGIRKRVPKAELHIIGYGPYESEVQRLASLSPAKEAIFLPGGMDHASLFREIPRFGVAFAPYLDDPFSYTWWCDPTKPKEYLACGLPLIITKVPWIWERVADSKKPLGLAIDYDRKQLEDAAVKLLGDERFYWRCRKNALDFAEALSWKKIYDQSFQGLAASN